MSGFVEIVGLGNANGNRKIKLWDNVTIAGTLDVGGLRILTLNTAGISAGGTTYSTATLKSKLDNIVFNTYSRTETSVLSSPNVAPFLLVHHLQVFT